MSTSNYSYLASTVSGNKSFASPSVWRSYITWFCAEVHISHGTVCIKQVTAVKLFTHNSHADSLLASFTASTFTVSGKAERSRTSHQLPRTVTEFGSDELDVALVAQLHRPYYIRMGPSCEALYCGHVPSIQYPTSLGGGDLN